jgi:hypothetical protein
MPLEETPQGEIVDRLRSCYRSIWNLPGRGSVDGQYYFVPETSPSFGESYFHSRNWHDKIKEPEPEYGELWDSQQFWVNGAAPPVGWLECTSACSAWNPSPLIWKSFIPGVDLDELNNAGFFPAGLTLQVAWTTLCRWFNGTGWNTLFGVRNWRLAWDFPLLGSGWRLSLTTGGFSQIFTYHNDGSNWKKFGPNEMTLVYNPFEIVSMPEKIFLTPST